jgi:outer membrane lipoprotein-sorting protein/peroxiredoxin
MHTILLLACLLQDDGLEKGRKLIELSAAKLKAAPAIYFETETTQGEAGSGEARVPTRSKAFVVGPDRMRWDSTGANGWDRLQLYDGKQVWDLDRARNEFSRQKQYRGTMKTRAWDDPLMKFILEKEPGGLLQNATDVVLSRQKEGGAEFDVLGWRTSDPYRRSGPVEYSLWFDADRLPRRYSTASEWRDRLNVKSVEYVKIDLAPKLADDVFTFKAPDGATEKSPYPASYGVPEDVRKILADVHKAFAGADSLSYEVETSSHTPSTEAAPTISRTFTTLKRPDMIRMESRAEKSSYMYVLDGETLWTTMSQGLNYTKQDLTTAGHRMVGGLDPFLSIYFEGEQPSAFTQGTQELGVTQDTLDGEKCDVIEWSYPQPEYKMRYRFYIDAARRPRMKTIESEHKGQKYRTTYSYKAFTLNPAIPKDHFTFTPGPEWTDRTNERHGEKLIAVGKAAPDFEAIDGSGAAVRLSSLQGSPVVLVFGWYSHAGEIERAQQFHVEYAKRGVTIVAVALDPEATPPDPKKFAVRFLRVKDKSVAKSYGVDYWSGGMYLLDADGKVLAATYANEDLKKAVDAAAGADK